MSHQMKVVIFLVAVGASVGFSRAEEARTYTPQSVPQSAPMRVKVIDATSFRDIETGMNYRLYGVDSCLPTQSANLGRQAWPCGAVAVAWLSNATLGKWVSCNVLREAGNQRLSRCASSEHQDLAADMLKEGLAIVLPIAEGQEVRAYSQLQDQARRQYKGLWSSQFVMPWELRAKQAADPASSR
jgi:endonuclease YncB( thermonuclease family)